MWTFGVGLLFASGLRRYIFRLFRPLPDLHEYHGKVVYLGVFIVGQVLGLVLLIGRYGSQFSFNSGLSRYLMGRVRLYVRLQV